MTHLAETCSCGATFEIIGANTDASYGAREWRRDHRCQRPCPHLFEQPLIAPVATCALCGHVEPPGDVDDVAVDDESDAKEVNGL